MLLFARWHCGAVISVSKYGAKGQSLRVGIDGHASGRYIQQDDAIFYRITVISCYLHVSVTILDGSPSVTSEPFSSRVAANG